jgi:phospholipase C
MSRLSLAILAMILFLPATTPAAEQTVLGSQLSVKNPSTPEKRKIGLSAKEKSSNDTLVGDPVANGATLTIRMTGGPVNGETYTLATGISPSTSKPFWSGDAVKGFKYKDSKGDNGPVSSASVSLKGGTFQIKVGISGKIGTINLVPPNPGADGCATLTINAGDSYSINLASGTPKNNGGKSFKISKPTQEGTCLLANPNDLPIDHIVVLMQENRSADNYLAQLSAQGQPAYEAEPTTGNPDPTNNLNPPIVPFHQTNYCEVADLDHSWKGTHAEVNNGLMNGFTAQNAIAQDPTGSRAMGYYDQTDLPFYFGLYTTFATGDRYFSSVQTQTFPNRLYLLAGTSFGYIRNDALVLTKPSVFNLLDNAGVTWRIYASEYPKAYGSVLFQYVASRAAVRVFPLAQYYTDLAAGTLPNVSFVDPDFGGTNQTENDEHPPSDIQVGQKFVADAVNGLMASPMWSTSAFFLVYDEHGGYYDHVAPPVAPVPDTTLPRWAGGDPHALFDHYGIRVPVVVISPYSKASSVSHVVHDHTSILRFIESRFALPALTNRDAAADPMLEFFDFNTPAFASPPSLPAAVIDPGQLAACGN